MKDALMAAVLENMRAQINEKIGAIRDTDTGEFLCAIDTSIWRSCVTICSALNLFFGMTQAPFQVHSLTTLGSKKPGQVMTSFAAYQAL
jgi:hypothetical protein